MSPLEPMFETMRPQTTEAPTMEVVDRVLALPLQAQLGVLRTIAPRILVCLDEAQRTGFIRDVAREIELADRGEHSYDIRPPARRPPEERELRWPKGYTRSDDRIREDVCEALAYAEHLDPTDIEVVVSGRDVSLIGTVPFRSHRYAAEQVCDSVQGVREIHNQLRVVAPEGRTRHDARAAQTYHRFLDHLTTNLGVPPERAEPIAIAVLGALEQRLIPEEAADLRSELPATLRELLASHPMPRPAQPRDIDREKFTSMIADDLGVRGDEAEVYARGVFRTLHQHVSHGEIEQVKHLLPGDIRQLWPS